MIPHTFGGRILDFQFPTSWQQLNQEQLRYVFLVITLFSPVKAKTYVFMRFTGIRVRKRVKGGWLCTFRLSWRKKLRFILQDWQVRSFLRQIDFISEPNAYPVRLDRIGGRYAIDAMLHGLSFEDYLCCENHYQGYLYSQDVSQLKALYGFLYKKKPGVRGSLKGCQRFTESRLFPHQRIRTGFRIPLVGKHQTVLRFPFSPFLPAVPPEDRR